MSESENVITSTTTTKLEKLLKIVLKFQKNPLQIHSIKITGDFFVYPEEVIETLEESLVGEKLEKKSLMDKISFVLKDCQLYGFDQESLADSIMQCYNRR